MHETHVSHEILCPDCGYSLRGIESDRCPECGCEIDRSALGQSIIPWVQRAKVGTYRAFWRTVRMASFRPRMLAREMTCPARFHDAVLFRRIAVLHAWPVLGVFFTLLCRRVMEGVSRGGDWWIGHDPLGSVLQIGGVVLGWVCIALLLLAGTGAPSYFFHPASLSTMQQNRAIALSYYASAPLAYVPIAAILGVAGVKAGEMFRYELLLQAIAYLVGLIPAGAVCILMISLPVRLLGATTHTGGMRQWALGVFLPMAWIVLAFLLLVVVPVCYVLLGLMIITLRS